MSLAALASETATTIDLVRSSVSAKPCRGPHSVGVIAPENAKASEEFSTWFWRCSTRPVTASTISV